MRADRNGDAGDGDERSAEKRTMTAEGVGLLMLLAWILGYAAGRSKGVPRSLPLYKTLPKERRP